MENEDRLCYEGTAMADVYSNDVLQGVPTAGLSIIDSTAGTCTATMGGARGIAHSGEHGNAQRMCQRSIGKSVYLSRRSDDDGSNSSSYDHHSSPFALRERGNEGVALNNVCFVPEVPSNVVPSNDNGVFMKSDHGEIRTDDRHQQVPVTKYEELELRILRQPEEQHRARYMSEGSRGSVKDRSGKSHCTVALRGYYRPAVLEIFAATGGGPVMPHPLYRVIPVTGKNGSSVTICKESVTEDGAACLQVVLRPENKMTAILDCIGILKICSYDLKRKLPKQNRSASVRLVFRITIPNCQDRRENVTLQTVSLPIICAQQPGYPDISKVSCTSCSVRGNADVFIVGKNFSTSATVCLKEYGQDGHVVWSAHASVDQQHIHTCHMICTVPPYRDLFSNKDVEVMLTVECGKKVSRPIAFKYLPDNAVTGSSEQHQQSSYSSYAIDGLNNGGPAVQRDTYQKYNQWPTGDLLAGGQQEQGQLPSNMNQQTTLKSNYAEFIDASPGAKMEPFPDEQNASFYYSHQTADKPPSKRHCGEDSLANDPFAFALDDMPIPQMMT